MFRMLLHLQAALLQSPVSREKHKEGLDLKAPLA